MITSILAGPKKIIRAIVRRHRRPARRWQVATAPIRHFLKHHWEFSGELLSVLVYDGHGKINCYGKRIRDGEIFQLLNLTIGTHGPRVTGRIAYPPLPRVEIWRQGYLVHGELFNLPENSWVALVNIASEDLLGEIELYNFPRQALSA